MSERHNPAWYKSGKNILILILFIVIGVQFVLLSGKPSGNEAPAPAESASTAVTADTPGVAGVFLEPDQGRKLLVVFDQPVPGASAGLAPAKAPALIAPPVPGKWTWQNAFMLRFEAADAFQQAARYGVTALPDNLGLPALAGKTEFEVSWGAFDVTGIAARAAVQPYNPEMSSIQGTISFNQPVDPKTLADFLKVIDPLRGADDPVPVFFTTTFPSTRIDFESDPVPRNAEAREITISVAPGLTPENGDMKLSAERSQTVSVFRDPALHIGKMEAVNHQDGSAIAIETSSPLDPKSADDAVKISPEIAFTPLPDGDRLLLTGDFTPGAEYLVRIAKGATATDGATLSAPYEARLVIPDLEPRVDFRDQGMFLARDGYKNLALTSVNTSAANVTVDRVYRNNLFSLFNFDYSVFNDVFYNDYLNQSLGDRIYSKRLPLPMRLNAKETTPFDLGNVISAETPGLYRIAAMVPGQWQGFQRWVLITDLGLVAKKGTDEALVFCASLTSLAAQPGTNITILSNQNQTLAKGVTDASGVFRAKIPAKVMEKTPPFLITAEKGGDFTFLLFDRFRIDMTGLDVSGETISGSGYAAFLYGERDIYRPGEVLQGMGMVRGADLAPPPAMPLKLVQKDPRGKKIDERAVKSDDRGMVPFSLALPGYLMTGPYSLELMAGEDVIGQYRFQVEDFVPDRINVRIAPKADMAAPGKELVATVLSRYLFGPPASGLDVEARARLSKAPFAPKGFEAYSFGDPERSFEDVDILEEYGNLDEAGEMPLTLKIPENLKPPAALEAVVTARVREGGGRGVTGMVRVPVHAYPYYPGLKRLDRDGVDPGKPVKAAFAAVSPEGKAVAAGELKASFYKDDWQTVLRKAPDGSFKYESVRDPKLIDSKTIPAGAEKGEITFIPPSYGSYRIVLADPATGASSQIEFYAGGWGYSPWAVENPARVELVPDKENYAAGETARFQVRAPFPGRILATVENGSVKDVQVIDLAGNTGEILVPVKAGYMPNVYVTATLLRKASEATPGEPARAFGAVPVNVDRETGHMGLTVAAPKDMQPLSPLTIEITGDPDADLTVAMVDEGILQLIAQKLPDPFGFFYAKRALAVDSFDTFGLLLPEVAPLLGKALAGGGDSLDLSKFVRSESPAKKSVVYWSGLLRTDASGKAGATFDVPEFMGAVRIMAVAAKGKRFGSAEATTRVKSPLSVSPTFPRFLSFAEKVMIPVTLRNDSGADGEFTAELLAKGPGVVETPRQTVKLASGKETTLYFPVRTASEEGIIAFEATAEGEGLSSRYAAEVMVRSPLPARTDVQAGTVEKQPLVLPDLAASGFLPGSAARDIYIGRQPLVRFAGNLKSLLVYPYGCVEQTVSRAFPLLYFGDLSLVLAPEAFQKTPPQFMVQSAIRRLASMQLWDGGFAMWPGGNEASDWGSVYATHFLVEALAAGYQVDREGLSDALKYLSKIAKNTDSFEPEALKRMAYALFVLSRAGWADIGAMDYLRDNLVPKMPSDARALLGAAYAAVGNMRAAGDLLSAKAPSAKGARETGGNLDSPLRDTALFLSTLLDAAPKDGRIPKLAQEVGRMLAAEKYPTTQENAFALLALGKYFARQASRKPFSGRVYAGSTLLADFDSDTVLNLQNIPDGGELRIEMDQGYEAGAAYYSVETRGIPTMASYKPAQNGVSVARKYLNRDGTPLEAAKVEQGALIVAATTVKSVSGPLDNVVIENLLPAGLEVENPRLDTTEKLPWMEKNDLNPAYVDLRGDRVLFFTALPDDEEHTHYALLRAVTPGTFQSPPAQVEAMYAPEIRASGELGKFEVEVSK